jgi:hypothetical protein
MISLHPGSPLLLRHLRHLPPLRQVLPLHHNHQVLSSNPLIAELVVAGRETSRLSESTLRSMVVRADSMIGATVAQNKLRL